MSSGTAEFNRWNPNRYHTQGAKDVRYAGALYNLRFMLGKNIDVNTASWLSFLLSHHERTLARGPLNFR